MKTRKRPLSHIWRGFIGASASILFIGVCLFPVLSELVSKPSVGLLRSISQIGGALLIAWSIQATLAVRASHHRDATQESIIGSLLGSTACGFLGIVVALGLAERAEAGHWLWADQMAFSVAASAFLFLGICLVLLVYFVYEWSRLDRIDPPE